jgi:DNA-binding transcriptional LysR family regulator
METRHLLALIAVADTGSVTRAAELLHVVQPAVTRYIRTLEAELDVELFERSRSGMRLTDVGRQVVHHARRALAELDRAREEAKSSGHEVRGIVTLGLLTSVAGLLAPSVVDEVSRSYPGIRLRVVTGYAGTLSHWLESGDVDMALLFDQPVSAGLRTTELLQEDLWVIAPEDGGLQECHPVPLADVLAHPLVMPSSPHGLRTLVEAAAARSGLNVDISVETNDASLQKRLVAAGHGWSVLPAIAAIEVLTGAPVSAAPISEPQITRTIVLAHAGRPAPTAAVGSVVDVLRSLVQTAIATGSWPSARTV